MSHLRRSLTVLILCLTGVSVYAQDRVLRAEFVLKAPVDQVWALWTTEAGIRSFLAPAANIEPKVDGLYEILFSPDKPPGQRGAEGLRIIAFEPPRRLVFTWNAPPDQPSIRAQRTVVELRLEPSGQDTRLTFLHWGWGSGPDWDRAFVYFDRAWGSFVLPSLVHRVDFGPIDWTKPAALKPFPTLRHTLTAASAHH